jgi:hypothetical protein
VPGCQEEVGPWQPHLTVAGASEAIIVRHSSTSLPAPETMRRLNHEILGYQHGRLSDDATAVLTEPGRRVA